MEIRFYEAPDGSSPVEEFIKRQSLGAQKKIDSYVRVLRQHDPSRGFLRAQYGKPLRDGIFELRPEWGNVEYRLLFTYLSERQAVVLLAFIKKARSVPNSQIDLALMSCGRMIQARASSAVSTPSRCAAGSWNSGPNGATSSTGYSSRIFPSGARSSCSRSSRRHEGRPTVKSLSRSRSWHGTERGNARENLR